MHKILIPCAAVLSALVLAACGSSDKKSNDTAAPAASSSSASAREVEMYDNSFKPKSISGKPGQTVKVELKNEGKAEHNFKIDGQAADADVKPGKSASVTVKIPASGSVQFYCEYHKALGMTGTVKAS